MSEGKVDFLESCLRRLRADYLLDYTVWKLLQTEKEMTLQRQETTYKNIYLDPEYQSLIQMKRYSLKQLKVYRIRITKLEEKLFQKTDIVDKDRLYQLQDYGQYRREVLSRQQNNDDLADAYDEKSPTNANQNSISPAKSAKNQSSATKKSKGGKKKKGGTKEKTDVKSIMPETFAKQEAQVKLVDLLLLEDPESGRDLEPQEMILRKKLL